MGPRHHNPRRFRLQLRCDIGYATQGLTSAAEAVAAVEKRIRELTREAMEDPAGPFEGSRKLAEAHLKTWLDSAQMPEGPSLA